MKTRTLFSMLTVGLLVTLATSAALANPWTRQQGGGYVNLNYQRIAATGFYAPSGDRVDINRFTQQTFNLYGEIGVLDRWLTATVDLALFRRGALDNQGATSGLGDARLGVWSGVLRSGNIRLSVGLLVGIPLGDDSPSVDGDQGATDIAALLPTGDGEVDIEWRVAFGYSFGGPGSAWPLRHYVRAEAGYWLRTRGFHDAFNYHTEVGLQAPWTFVDRFWLIARFFGSESFAGTSAPASIVGLGDGVTFTSWGLELHGRIWRGLGASAGFAGALRARNVPAGAQLKFALDYEF
jgi:hypothetical protein